MISVALLGACHAREGDESPLVPVTSVAPAGDPIQLLQDAVAKTRAAGSAAIVAEFTLREPSGPAAATANGVYDFSRHVGSLQFAIPPDPAPLVMRLFGPTIYWRSPGMV